MIISYKYVECYKLWQYDGWEIVKIIPHENREDMAVITKRFDE